MNQPTWAPYLWLSLCLHLGWWVSFGPMPINDFELSPSLRPSSLVRDLQLKLVSENRALLPAPKKVPVVKPDLSKRVLPNPSEVAPADPRPASEVTSPVASSNQDAKTTLSIREKYLLAVSELISEHKHYPQKALRLNQEGIVVLRLRINRAGQILALEVIKEAQFKLLTDAALETIRRIKKFPPIPIELAMDEISIKVPVEYRITI